MKRREFIKWMSAAMATSALPGCTTARSSGSERKSIARVIVIGGGFAGATAAKYIRLWGPGIEVVLVERNSDFISCPMSNRVLAGSLTIDDLTRSYKTLTGRYGIRVIWDEAVTVDVEKRKITLSRGNKLSYDRLVVAPGIDFMYHNLPGLEFADGHNYVPHAWKAGRQTEILRNQLEAMPDGGIYALCIPRIPYRCPPAPYERACQVAHYFKAHKPKSKVLILDANEDIVSKKDLFTKAWNELYPGMVEYRPNSVLVDVDTRTLTAMLQFEDVRAQVLNIIPEQRAGYIAQAMGLVTANGRWCEVDFLTYESVRVKNVHVLGDAILAAPAMPKSGHMANQQAKACAAAVAALLHGESVNPEPILANTCYSFVSDKAAGHVASVHQYDAEHKTMAAVPGSGGLSSVASEAEARYAEAWAQNIWNDMLG